MDRSIIAVIGGDARQIALANMLASEGNTVYCSGFEHTAQQLVGTASTDPITAAHMADIVILPMPPTRDGKNLNAPLSRYCIHLDGDFCSALCGKEVFTGMAEKLRKVSSDFAQLNLIDYGASEAFLQRNAQATAEGALAEIITHYPRTVCGSRILITGCGRISCFLAPMLRALGGEVSVASRKSGDRAKTAAMGMEAMSFSIASRKARNFGLIINTVPAPVVDYRFIEGVSDDVVFLELASSPGGIDLDACKKRNLRVISAPGLPGKYSPLSAAEAVKETVMSILEED